jgi:DNA replication initiation complex subunit (GINS family)
MMNCKLDVTVGDVYLYSEGATKAMYKRLPNDDTTRKALEAYRARRLQQQPASTNVVVTDATNEGEPTEEPEEEAEEVVTSINHVQMSDIHQLDHYPAPDTTELY